MIKITLLWSVYFCPGQVLPGIFCGLFFWFQYGAWSSGGTFAAGVAGSQIVVIGVNLQEVAIAFLLIQSLWGQRAGGTAFDTGKAFPFP